MAEVNLPPQNAADAELTALRANLAEIDKEIVELVSRRNRTAQKIGEIKASLGLDIVVPQVEGIVEKRYVDAGKKAGVSPITCRKICRAVIDESVELQGLIARRSDSKRIFIVGGNGLMGRWLSRFFTARGHCVSIYDVNSAGHEFPVLSFAEGCQNADVVVVSVPVLVAAEVLTEVFSLVKGDSLVFDILSVKAPVSTILKNAAAQGLCVTSVHPMFGPSAISPANRNVLVCACGCAKADAMASNLFSGGLIRHLPIDGHDKVNAYVLSLSHAVNLAFSDALLSSGFSSEEMRRFASSTFRKQAVVSEEVAEENAELYYAIQRENPYNDEALAKLERAVHFIRTADKGEFVERMHKEGEWFRNGKENKE